MSESEFMASWFPFTVEEITAGFLGMGLSEREAREAAHALGETVRSMNEESGFGITEFGNFLTPVAALSDDAARRVAEFRATWGA